MLLLALAQAHVPTYPGGGTENCYTPPHTHTTSQVIYLKGSGGLEIPVKSPTEPFNTLGGELIDFDIVLRDEIDPTTYAIYVGCGGCVGSEDPLLPQSRLFASYQHPVLEPFTQTWYRSVVPEEERKFNSSLLETAACKAATAGNLPPSPPLPPAPPLPPSSPTESPSEETQSDSHVHFTVRLVDFGNRTDGKPIVWGAVVGLGEVFTFWELLSFPLYILYNHGETWNEVPWTAYLWLFVFAPLILAYGRSAIRACGCNVLDASPIKYTWNGKWERSLRPVMLRAVLYELALIGFIFAAGEMLTHFFIAQSAGPSWTSWEIGVALGGVIIGPNLIGILYVLVAWSSMLEKAGSQGLPEKAVCKRCRMNCWKRCLSCSGHALWGPLEIVTGFSMALLFGAGFFVAPIAIGLSGLLRTFDALTWPFAMSIREPGPAIETTAPEVLKEQESSNARISLDPSFFLSV